MGDVQRLSQTIRWSHDRSGRLSRAAQVVLYTVVDLAQALTRGGTDNAGVSAANAEFADPRIDNEPYGYVLVTGSGPALPSTTDGPHVATVWQHRLTIATAGDDAELPVATLQLIRSEHLGPPGRPKKALDAHWRCAVADHEHDLTIEGSWLLLAHLATLANWAEPTAA